MPFLGLAAREKLVSFLGTERVARRVTRAAMSKPLDKIGTPVQFGSPGRVGLEFSRAEKQQFPARHEKADIEWER
jgi:hypothetical protein